MKTNREHKADLVISKVADQISATMTITYDRGDSLSIVQETFASSFRDNQLLLTGAGFTSVRRGNSVSYSLDSFELDLTEDETELQGRAILRNGTRKITFVRKTMGASPELD